MYTINEIIRKFGDINDEIRRKFGGNITIVAVTKYVNNSELISKLINFGIKDLGESYAQNLEKRIYELKSLNFEYTEYNWHFIGHLQLNKVKKVVPLCEYIQSVDSIKLLEKINSEAKKNNKIQKFLIEIKVSSEETKFGILEEDVFKFVEDFINLSLDNIRLCGVMAMAPYFENSELTRPYFRRVRKLFEKIQLIYKDKLPYFEIVSMGMSNDYLVALEEGSNMVRIGSKIFGV